MRERLLPRGRGVRQSFDKHVRLPAADHAVRKRCQSPVLPGRPVVCQRRDLPAAADADSDLPDPSGTVLR